MSTIFMLSLCLLSCSSWWAQSFLSQWALFACSHYALMELAGTIFVPPIYLLHFRVPISPGWKSLHASGALVFVAASQGTPLDCLVLKTRRPCITGSHGTVTIRETILGRLSPPGYCTDIRLKYTPAFL